jgi:hypothetical protein
VIDPNEALPQYDVMTIDSNGSVTARPEWQSHLLTTHVNGDWRTKLIEMPKLLAGK